ncbi:MAG: DUF4261 domain-containing protein [Methanomassiliicoccaceae archaeon]|nr:DUF4261 domain-containing protein [Methanomassiliicoccaceae archaeon]
MKKKISGVLKQDLNEEAKYSGVYTIWLLFLEKCEVPPTAVVLKKLKERFGEVDVVSGGPNLNSFALCSHKVTYKGKKEMPLQVIITGCDEVTKPHGDDIARTQFWDGPDDEALLDSCGYQVMVSDFLAAGLPPLERASILSDLIEIALELFPTCAAVYVDASGRLLTAERMRGNPYEGPLRFIWFGVNARFFNIQNTEDSLVDTLGLYALGLPDMQYHFHGLDPNEVVDHAYNTAIYQFENDAPIKSGETISGFSPDSRWKCQYERSLIQPSRDVLDVEMGEFASGKRRR